MEGSTNSNSGNSFRNNPMGYTPSPRVQSVLDHMNSDRLDAVIWILRLFTLLFSILYLIPLLGIKTATSFKKALLSCAATNSLRLHQFLPTLPAGRGIMSRLILDDTFHYLVFSLMFCYSPHHFGILFPITLYSLMHSTGYSLLILGKLNYGSSRLAELLRSIQGLNQQDLLLCIAYAEIFLFPYLMLLIYQGSSSVVTLFMLYQFLNMRYMSQGNPYTREAFHSLRIMTNEIIIQNVRCPVFIRTVTTKVVDFLVQMAPVIEDFH